MRATQLAGRPVRFTFLAGFLAGMLLAHPAFSNVVINEIHYNCEPNTAANEFVELYNTAASPVDISGWAFSDGVSFTFPPGSVIPANGFVVVAERPSSLLSQFGLTAYGPYQGELSGDGERVALRNASGVMVDEVTYQAGFPWPVGAAGTGASMELIHPSLDNDLGGSWRSSLSPSNATPGAINSVFSTNAPPQIRQVNHTPKQPKTNETVLITAKVTDPNGVASVTIEYQVNFPGNYTPAFVAKTTTQLEASPNTPRAVNPGYTNGWIPLPMLDNGTGSDAVAGDGIYSVTLPVRPNRTLIRYRIKVQDSLGALVRVPYPDDASLNFAYFVYNGVPDYVANTQSVNGSPPYTHSASVISSVPVYHLLVDSNNFYQCLGFNTSDQIPRNNFDARDAYNWSGAFVYEGEVYDNIGYRLRQRNARYSPANGKRSFNFKFNRGRYPRFRDMDGNYYPQPWDTLSTHKMIGSRSNPYWGLDQVANSLLWNLTGTPASHMHWFHLRVVNQGQEAPTTANGQYFGDFYGLMLAIEDYDVRFLESHNLEKGNVYKLMSYLSATNPIATQKYQAQDAVSDGSDLQNIAFNLRPERTDAWLLQHVNYDQWNRYHAIVDAIRHYDYQPNTGEHLKNRAYYFQPSTNSPLGWLWTLPWDSDTSWGPNFNGGVDFKKQAIFGYSNSSHRTNFVREYKNVVREIRDLVWTEEQITLLLDPLAERITPFSAADRDRWLNAPVSAGVLTNLPPVANMVADMKKFAFIGGSWTGGNDGQIWEAIAKDSGLSGQQGRDAYLDALADDPLIPSTPIVTATGPVNYPVNRLTFEALNYSGVNAFAAWKWRIAEVTLTNSLPLPANTQPKFEITANWQSEEITEENNRAITIPANAVRANRTYRVRVRAKDATGRWSHWSAPVQFATTEPDSATALLADLKITELMYNAPAGNNFDFVELHNANPDSPLELGGAKFTQGIDYTFANGTTIPAGGYLVLIKHSDFAAFRAHYNLDTNVALAGPYAGNFDNDGELVTLRTSAGGTDIVTFTYNDARGWPIPADGSGHSLIPLVLADQADGALNYGGNWRASTYLKGSPGRADPDSPDVIVINEVTAHTDYPLPPPEDSNDWIELHNRSATNFTFGSGWYLSDNSGPTNLAKWMIPPGTVVPAGGFVTFDERTGFHNPPTTGFGLNKGGEQVVLSYLPGNTNDRVVDSVAFKGQENGWSLGRHQDGDPYWHGLSALTRNTNNAAPPLRVSISEIMYHPPDLPGGVDDTTNEFVEIFNPTTATVPPYNTDGPWRIGGGIAFTFPTNTTLASSNYAVLVSFNPTDTAKSNAFRNLYGAAPNLRLFGPYTGKLANSTDRVALERPQAPDAVGDPISWVIVDEVIYADRSPWEQGADGIGPSLQRLSFLEHGCNPANWRAATVSLGSAYGGGAAPAITNQPAPASQIVAVGSTVTYSVGAHSPDTSPLRYQWLRDNSPINGATNHSLLISNAVPSNSGKYRAVVLNSSGSALSSSVNLLVKNLPVITQHPADASVRPGTNVTFTINATGAGPLAVNWFRNNTFISSNGPSLILTNVQPDDEGIFFATVSDVNGTVVSDSAQLIVLVDPTVVIPPAGQTIVAGQNVTLAIATEGTLPMTYHWKKDGATVKIETINSHVNLLSILNAQTSDSGSYTVLLTNAASHTPGVLSPAAQLTVLADTDGDGMPDLWESEHGLDPDNPNDNQLDNDQDGFTNLAEYLAGTDPNDPESYLKIENIQNTLTLPPGVQIGFLAVSNRTYSVLFSDELLPNLWEKLTDIPATTTNRFVQITNQPSLFTPQRYYRLVTPRQDEDQ